MKKMYSVVITAVLASLVLAACGAGSTPAPTDLLEAIKQRGYILVSTDPNYEPQSFLNTEGSRPSDTKCPADALTTAEMQGFDVDVAKAIGEALGVETCFATPSWDAITAGNWADKWDVSVGSMTVLKGRQEILDFSVPYYYSPAAVAVRADSGFTSVEDLAGQAICAGTATTYEAWAANDFTNPNAPPESSVLIKAPADVTVVPLETDQECAQAIEAGREDFLAYATSGTVVDANIAAGMPVVKLEPPIYFEQLAAAFDKSSTLSTDTLRAEVDKVFTAMHEDGRLSELSNQWFGVDYTKANE
ncbi:MAG TPA: transporter substrate-binding domain-containing protein [Anaerolineales bacterium]|nr:transporter substrate-binding domain-containing protein [Anaerolineales bacterium]